jgi:hypothetical protein
MSRALENRGNTIRLPVYKFGQLRRARSAKWSEDNEISSEELEKLFLVPRLKTSLDDTIDETEETPLLDLFSRQDGNEPDWYEDILLADMSCPSWKWRTEPL